MYFSLFSDYNKKIFTLAFIRQCYIMPINFNNTSLIVWSKKNLYILLTYMLLSSYCYRFNCYQSTWLMWKIKKCTEKKLSKKYEFFFDNKSRGTKKKKKTKMSKPKGGGLYMTPAASSS